MRISERKINKSLEKELAETLFQLIADLKNPDEAKVFLKDFFHENELTTIVKRLAVAYWLKKGRTVTNIRENLAVSSATIESIKRQLKSPGLTLALKKIEAEAWANKWTERIKKLVK